MVPLEAPGLPLVSLVDESGHRVHGLIDTGAPMTAAVTEGDEGTYEVRARDGRVLVRAETVHTVNWPGLRIGGHRVTLLIGLDVLESIDFELDLGGGSWRLIPRE